MEESALGIGICPKQSLRGWKESPVCGRKQAVEEVGEAQTLRGFGDGILELELCVKDNGKQWQGLHLHV